MKCSSCRCRSQTTLRRAPRTGRQEAYTTNTAGAGGAAAGGADAATGPAGSARSSVAPRPRVLVGVAIAAGSGVGFSRRPRARTTFRDRFVEAIADVARGAIRTARGEARRGLAAGRRALQEAVQRRRQAPAVRGQQLEERLPALALPAGTGHASPRMPPAGGSPARRKRCSAILRSRWELQGFDTIPNWPTGLTSRSTS